jgi:energy-coupling factor transport system ATP-binding protein
MKIRFENVWFAYENLGASANQEPYHLQDISFEIGGQEFVGLVGRSGSGKTTLMQLCNGLLLPTHGRVLVDERDIHAPDYDLAALRRRVGLVFQFPETQIFATTVSEEVAFGPRQQNLSQQDIAQRVAESLHQVGLDESFAGRNPFTLSQGEKRRVALAGVLAMRPEILVLDEPTASLDGRGIAEVRGLLRRWLKSPGGHASGRTLLTISHDFDLIASLCPRLLILERGRLLYDGLAALLWQGNPLDSAQEILQRAGLPLPRSERLRRHLAGKGLRWVAPQERQFQFCKKEIHKA